MKLVTREGNSKTLLLGNWSLSKVWPILRHKGTIYNSPPLPRDGDQHGCAARQDRSFNPVPTRHQNPSILSISVKDGWVLSTLGVKLLNKKASVYVAWCIMRG